MCWHSCAERGAPWEALCPASIVEKETRQRPLHTRSLNSWTNPNQTNTDSAPRPIKCFITPSLKSLRTHLHRLEIHSRLQRIVWEGKGILSIQVSINRSHAPHATSPQHSSRQYEDKSGATHLVWLDPDARIGVNDSLESDQDAHPAPRPKYKTAIEMEHADNWLPESKASLKY